MVVENEFGPVVQLNRTSDSGSESRGFESRRGHKMNKSTHPFMQLLVMLAIALGMTLVASIFVLLLPLMGVPVTTPAGLRWGQVITSLLAFAVPVLVMTAIYYKGSAREYYGLEISGRTWGVALAGVMAMLLVVPVNEVLTEWNDSWDLGAVGRMLRSIQEQTEGVLDTLMSADTVGGLVANLLVVALTAAVCEELFFRCGIQNLLQRWFRNRHAAVWVAAAVFSIAHGELFSFVPRFVLGVLLGYLYAYGRSPLPNMLAHFVNNAIVVVLYWLVARGVLDIDPEAPLRFPWPLTVGCTIAAVAVMWVTLSGNNRKNSSV